MRRLVGRNVKFTCMLMAGVLLTACGSSAKETKKQEEEKNVIVVDADTKEQEGKSYQTIGAAFEYVNENPPASEEERLTIKVTEGVYREQTTLTAPYITLKGSGEAEDSILTFYYGCSLKYASQEELISAKNGASTYITETAHDFIAENITFENSHNIYVTDEEKKDYSKENEIVIEDREKEPWNDDYETQALALRVQADRSAFKNCRFVSRQDTMLLDKLARCYFTECFIEGTVDFIYGDATAVFEDCILNSPYETGYLTASSCPQNAPYGYLFKDCSFTREPIEGVPAPKDGEYALGRPWNSHPQVIFWNCKMDSHIAEKKYRFVAMSHEYKLRNCRYIECGTMDIEGNPLNLADIVPDYEIIMTEEELQEKYTVKQHLAAQFDNETQTLKAADNWVPVFMKQ